MVPYAMNVLKLDHYPLLLCVDNLIEQGIRSPEGSSPFA